MKFLKLKQENLRIIKSPDFVSISASRTVDNLLLKLNNYGCLPDHPEFKMNCNITIKLVEGVINSFTSNNV